MCIFYSAWSSESYKWYLYSGHGGNQIQSSHTFYWLDLLYTEVHFIMWNLCLGHCEYGELLWALCWMDMKLILTDTRTRAISRPIPFTLWYYPHWWQYNKQTPWQWVHIVEIPWIGIVTRMYLKVLIILNSDRSVIEQYFYQLAFGTWDPENRKKYTWV